MRIFTESEMQVACARYFRNTALAIVPNVKWGAGFRHELDVLVITKAWRAYEVEIKCSRADLRADARKTHGHESKRVSRLYFCVPAELVPQALETVPDRAGVLSVKSPEYLWPSLVRPAKQTGNFAWSNDDLINVLRLGALRIWPLIEALNRLEKQAY